ncbi:hypothetical protein T265_06681 [Opisthorchis viverrini]|uniref:Uncharacterized protein n=1 Tax=Opisthorchis viverrini TaxID=6198 RepID=A0A075ADC9_OPIVI|nr:hypothetical protein T265_06681 [Opisthorchis viverrini]KER25989.1 hypothetical protein T265_06681 [Opisthorchis viverrini]
MIGTSRQLGVWKCDEASMSEEPPNSAGPGGTYTGGALEKTTAVPGSPINESEDYVSQRTTAEW